MSALTAGLNSKTASVLSWQCHSQRRPQPSVTLDVRLPHGEQLSSHRLNRKSCVKAAAFAEASAALPPFQMETVADVMTKKDLCIVNPDTSLDDALEMLVERKVTGLPVVDGEGRVVGVVSDYDMLALEGVADAQVSGTGIFPEVELSWATFNQVQRLIQKTTGKTVADVMTEDPIVVRGETNTASAARMLLDHHLRRLPVVDDTGRLIGLFTRRDVMAAALDSSSCAPRPVICQRSVTVHWALANRAKPDALASSACSRAAT